MHFCSECHNMYYLKIRDENEEVADSLIYYCRNCGHEDTTLTGESVCVSDTQLRRSEQKFTHMVNEYTKYDPTLPRINTIKCPNQECSSNSDIKGGAGASTIKKTPAKITLRKSAKTKVDLAAKKEEAEQEQEEEATAKPATAKEQATAQQASQNNNREVIYIRYDDINMKYVYLCVHCDTTWKTDNR